MIRVSDLAIETGIPSSEIKGWIAKGRLSGIGVGNEYLDEISTQKVRNNAANPHIKDKLLVLTNSFSNAYATDILEYNCFHESLDVLCWMLKIRYSTKDSLSRRRFQLLDLAEAFLRVNIIDFSKIRRVLGASANLTKLEFFLKKGLYNEMAYCLATPKSYLNVGRRIDTEEWKNRFPSWSIITAYYAIYEFTSTLAVATFGTLNPKQHLASINSLEAGGFSSICKVVNFYPFNLPMPPKRSLKSLRGHQTFWSNKYAAYPRDGSSSIYELESNYLSLIALHKSFIHHLYEFRVWANYTGIETLLRLENGGLLAFLYRNLQTLIFFAAIQAELTALALLGEAKFTEIIQEAVILQIPRHGFFDLSAEWYPAILRMRLYQAAGILSTSAGDFIPKHLDPFTSR